ncbi:hypothetical protein QCA50_016371 [Cerrena zonata]|uniref:DUF6589 domain-containing protein n=1 Tax=Cerrena zonata TaxID=2478898 RepID=A0AAW0FQT7_9APHY
MTLLSPAQISEILHYLKSNYHASLVDLVISAVTLNNNPMNIFMEIVHRFLNHDVCGPLATEIILQVARERYMAQLSMLASKASGWHFSAKKAKAHRIEDLDIEPMLEQMQQVAPDLCMLVGDLLSANKGLAARRENRAVTRERRVAERRERQAQRAARNTTAPTASAEEQRPSAEIDSDEELWRSVDDTPTRYEEEENEEGLWAQLPDNPAEDPDGDDEEAYWRDDFEPHMPEDPTDATSGHDVDCAYERRHALLKIKTVTCLSIMMQSTNQRCNALQMLIGLFMHACNTSEAVVEFLAHAGISISMTAVNDAITNLSVESVWKRRKIGQTLRTAYGVDNVDMELKHIIPSVENLENTMVHLTSATMLPLYHGVKAEDLKCSNYLWEKTKERILTTGTHLVIPNFAQLLNIHPECEGDLTRRDRFNAWVFLQTLVLHGPEWFRKFQSDLGELEAIECIPLVKTEQVPAQAMDINPSTAAGNADVLNNVLKQGGVGDPEQEGALAWIQDIGDHVVIVHGDLGTGERIESLQGSRAEEDTPWLRFQFIIFVLGLFHLKMACADAIWRIFIQPLKARKDPHSLLEHVALLRPKETGKIGSKPGFRRMHEVIQHVGIVT